MSDTIQWGILSTGAIAKTFARNIVHAKTGKLVAVASRTKDKAEQFGNEFNVPRRHASYESLLADKDVQAVYIATPHPQHAEWAIRAMEAGKHVLVEKPIGVNHAQAMAMVEAAVNNKVFLMEAFMYRCHPQTAKLVELLKSGVIGKVGVINGAFSFQAGFNADSRLWRNDYAGGGIMDVGCYPVSIARLIAGAANGKDFEDPTQVVGTAKLNEQTKVDEYAVASLKFPGDIVANLATGIALTQENAVRIFGSEGSIYLPNPWASSRSGGGVFKIFLTKRGAEQPEEITVECNVTSYTLEIDVVGNAIRAGKQQASSPAMSWDDSLGNMKTIEQWRYAIGEIYDIEKPENVKTIHGRPLEAKKPTKMKYGKVEGVTKQVSRLVLGVDNVTFAQHVAVMCDDFFERGGNVWDTAYIYGGGKSEKALGDWIKSRNLREQVVILDKGAHTPFCDPVNITKQHKESLQRLSTDYVDIYMMHRDNPAIPVGEFVDVLNEHLKAGTMKAIGGSNWSLQRIDEFNEYARKNGKRGFSAISNNFSLARMVDPVWGGCIAASDPESRAWFKKTQMPLMPWSSQARGFFTDRAGPDKKDDPELVRCWYSEDNFRRRARVEEMAKKRNVLPINIALAYVLCQPFPTFPLIGPRQLSETRTSFPALEIDLSEQEVKWLNLEVDKY